MIFFQIKIIALIMDVDSPKKKKKQTYNDIEQIRSIKIHLNITE